MILGGFSTANAIGPRPQGASAACSRSWRLGEGTLRALTGRTGRSVLVAGRCGVSDFELSLLAESALPVDVAWRWSGAYAVIEETDAAVVIHTDPAAAQPVYATRWESGWVWSTSARLLAALTGASIDTQRLACAVFLPSVPALAAGRTFFDGVRQLPPGARVELPANGTTWRVTTQWRPDPVPGWLPDLRLYDALAAAVALQMTADPALSCDLSGGLDSTSIALLAATALPTGRRLNAITIHPNGDLGGADLRHARLAASRYPHRIDHHLLPLTERHLPYTAISEVPATDEPAPSTLTQARLTGQLDWMRDVLGTRTHLTGDGGDSVLFQPPIHLADLLRHRRLRRAAGEAIGWARLRHTSVGPLLWGAARATRTGRSQALATLAASIGTRGRDDHGLVVWFPLLAHPAWAAPSAARLVTEAAGQAAAEADPLQGLDFSVRTLVDEIREVARTAAADTQLAAASGVELHNPFLDPLVVDAVLTTPLDRRPALHAYKPVLARAMSGLLPAETAARTTKGSFDADHYTGLRTNLAELSALADGYLAALGLLQPGRFRKHLAQAAAGLPMPLATLEQALTVEAWLIAHHRDPAPDWIRTPARPEPCV
ncbi:albusnodin/ikarugamycin family macrolactam cyclase [Kitasatospora sp. NBC_01287]|uniref:albusnodin/ikarugamycin family macrolactam cyclase n=1 Tax=Kitasatospora sp. NBC_01287 TaxID=2903573 RepID=UPI0022570023|nr:albusnodin/ikarugamycin family macrolactam cyclase [Kitasatospora sp. NBC_01287]MCX4745307.1 albusnodin/ikarugamycin family macrolactam cyclase [Kitasatospora sp. NBC_01287]